MKHEMKLVDNLAGGVYAYEGSNDKGQTIRLEIRKIEGNPKDKNFLGNLWAKHGFIKKPISSYWVVEESILDPNTKDCFTNGDFNLIVTDYKINAEGMKEATQEQLDKIIAYANKALNEPIHTMKEKDTFDKIGNVASEELKEKAKECAKHENPYLKYVFDKVTSYVSNGDVDGFYFHDYDTRLKCIAFKNGSPIPVYAN